MLYPQNNSKRRAICLDGIWKYDTVGDNFSPTQPLSDGKWMAVPASVNEIVTDSNVRDYVGQFAFETETEVPSEPDKIHILRFGAVSHRFRVFVNGEEIGACRLGFLPLECEIPERMLPHLRITVLVDNRLNFQTLPVGRMVNGKQEIKHDFANDTGILQNVTLLTLPKKHISDITIKTFFGDNPEKVQITVSCEESATVTIIDGEGKTVAVGKAEDGTTLLTVKTPNLWSCGNPYLYTAEVRTVSDLYRQSFGIRKVEIRGGQFLVNHQPIRFKGFGKHADFPILGKGENTAVSLRDFELLRWIGANSFRTSHYPYSEEIMDLADRYGILVIDEVPAVGMNWWGENDKENLLTFCPERVNEETREVHWEALQTLWKRDKNHPSVVMISVGNEAGTDEDGARDYFAPLIENTRSMTGLPVTFAEFTKCEDTKIGDLVDVISINRYYGWYYNHGELSVVEPQFREEIEKWYKRFGKPVLITEYGADTVEGLHSLPPESFSEEFQVEYLREAGRAIDESPYCIGDLVWNFADFRTKQGINRVRGNRKGVFTRDRNPKSSAFFLRERWKKK